MELLKQYQADIMLLLSGICGIITLLIYMTNTISEKRKLALMQLEICAMFLVIADRRAYIFRGDTSDLGWWMVRISNFLVFFLTLAVIYSFDLYLVDLFTHEGGLEKAPRRLRAVKWLTLVGFALVIISQFTGFYYTFDEMNRYQREPGFVVCYMIPMIMMFGCYVILNGHLSPGGGFSGGAVIGAAMILYLNAFGSGASGRFLTIRTFRFVSVLALSFYSLSKAYSFFTGANHLPSVFTTGVIGNLFSAGLIPYLNIAVGLVVCFTMYAFFALFRKGDI